MSSLEINILAIITAAMAGTIAGTLWYAVFLKKDDIILKEEFRVRKWIEKPKKTLSLSFAANLISAFALFLLFNLLNSWNFLSNAKIAGAVWLAFAIVSAVRKILIEKKTWENFILGAGHDFVSLMAMVAVLTVWK